MNVERRTRITQAVRGLLENPNEPVSELSYFDCIESVMENSKVTGHGWLFPLDYLGRALKLSGRCAAARLAIRFTRPPVWFPQVLGESMAGISQHCKTGDVVAFGESVGVASKALCGLTEAAGQVSSCRDSR